MNTKDLVEGIADAIELKFDLEKFYPFEEKIIEIFKEIEYNIQYVEYSNNKRSN